MTNISSTSNNIKTPAVVGVINPPDQPFDRGLYNDVEAKKKFYNLDKDMYQAEKNASYETKTKTPTGIIVSIGIVASAIVLKKTGLISKVRSALAKKA